MVEKVPDSTYDVIGGLDKQIKEIKEVIELPVRHPELFDSLGLAQPKVRDDNSLSLKIGSALGSVVIRAAWYREDTASQSCCTSYGVHFY